MPVFCTVLQELPNKCVFRLSASRCGTTSRLQASAKLMPNSRLRPEIYVFQHVNAVLGKSCLSHAFHASPKLNATVFGAVRSLNSIFWQLLQTAFHGLHAMPIAKRFTAGQLLVNLGLQSSCKISSPITSVQSCRTFRRKMRDSVFKTKQQTSNSSTAHANSNIKSLCNYIRRYSKKCRTQTKRNNQKRRTQRKQLRPISWTQAKRNKIHQKKLQNHHFGLHLQCVE